MAKVTIILVYCWHCSKRFYIEINNVYAGRLFCNDECKIASFKRDIELEKKEGGIKIKMNKNLTGARIKVDKDKIIEMYQDNMRVTLIAKKYNVVESTIYMNLKNWGIPLKRGVWVKQAKPREHREREFSLELLAKRKENTRINNKYIKYYKVVETPHEKFLVRDLLIKSEVPSE